MAEPVTLEQVLAELRSLDVEQMQSALGIVGEYDDPMIADALLEVLPSLSLDDGYGYVAALVVGCLGALGDQRAVRPILDLLDQNLDTGDDHQLEEVGCEALVNLGAVAALPFLRAALTKWSHHEDTVAHAITAIGGAGEAAFFIEALESRTSAIAIAAARSVATLGALAAIPRLERLRKSKKNDVRRPALIAITQLQPDRAPALLGELLEDAKDDGEKTGAIVMIGNAGVVGLVPSLLAKLADSCWCDSPWLRFAILDALSALGYPDHTARRDPRLT
jgi:HEAT repeat protein